MTSKEDKPERREGERSIDAEADPMEQAKRIMKRLAETPYEPHKPLGRRANKSAPTPKTKEPPASKGRVHKGKTRN
jgi:hypothetical protein